MCHPTDRIAHTPAFVTSVVEHWLEREKHPQGTKPYILGLLAIMRTRYPINC